VDNTVEGLVLGGTRGRPGNVYFVTDGEPVVFRDFLTAMLGTQGVEIPDRSVPPRVAELAARAAEGVWRRLRRPGNPPLTRFAVWVSSQECTIDISRAERELGYRPVRSRDEGLAELRS
jgi:nucleoside-diphosphate-sugar epimerase